MANGLPWPGFIWNKSVNPKLTAFSWHLLLRKTPTDLVAKNRGCTLASRCHNCHLSEESDYHLFFSCNLTNALRSWLLAPYVFLHPAPTTSTAIWEVTGGDVSNRQLAAAVFFHAISILCLLRNDSKHNNRKSTLEHAKVIFEDRIRYDHILYYCKCFNPFPPYFGFFGHGLTACYSFV